MIRALAPTMGATRSTPRLGAPEERAAPPSGHLPGPAASAASVISAGRSRRDCAAHLAAQPAPVDLQTGCHDDPPAAPCWGYVIERVVHQAQRRSLPPPPVLVGMTSAGFDLRAAPNLQVAHLGLRFLGLQRQIRGVYSLSLGA
jgi:hypothetical protein